MRDVVKVFPREMVQTILQDAPGQAEAAYGVIQKLMAGEDVE
ncbi:hypothetical protein [Agathobaculum sp.]|nr:hypothetical protein [Agathobaculum sp.]MDY3619001.1 hypothetical protein [Agathobaculum sp.]